MTFLTPFLFVLGLVLLVAGAELLVRGASRLAAALGISPLVIGLTIVAFGTSAPEMAVSVQSAFTGQGDIAFGNVVGSNIFNVLLILGLSAIIAPLVVHVQLIRIDVPVMIGVSLLGLGLSLDLRITRLEGAVLFAGIVAYTVWLHRASRREPEADREASSVHPTTGSRVADVGRIVVGLGLLVLGSRWLVGGAIAIAQYFELSELVIGLTIVAAGTSLPEVATSVLASIRGERDIAVGNVVGSNIFNILAVLGAAALVAPDGVPVAPAARDFDALVMIVVAVACLPIFFTGYIISRWEGLVFLGYYGAYTTYLILSSSAHDALGTFSSVMWLFVIPLTLLTLALVTWRALSKPR